MQMSQEGIDALLKKFEGCKLKAYRCPAGVCTIGYGHTSAAGNPTVVDGLTIRDCVPPYINGCCDPQLLVVVNVPDTLFTFPNATHG